MYIHTDSVTAPWFCSVNTACRYANTAKPRGSYTVQAQMSQSHVHPLPFPYYKKPRCETNSISLFTRLWCVDTTDTRTQNHRITEW